MASRNLRDARVYDLSFCASFWIQPLMWLTSRSLRSDPLRSEATVGFCIKVSSPSWKKAMGGSLVLSEGGGSADVEKVHAVAKLIDSIFASSSTN